MARASEGAHFHPLTETADRSDRRAGSDWMPNSDPIGAIDAPGRHADARWRDEHTDVVNGVKEAHAHTSETRREDRSHEADKGAENATAP